jgi:nucleotide-binding universal stress UspA family protein
VYHIIMAPTNGSGFDREAIRVATKLSNASDAQLRLVRVYNAPLVFTGPDAISYPHEAVERERKWERSQLAALAAECANETTGTVTPVLEEGPVPDALRRYARLNDVDLIVISSHSRGGFARLALGSVTDSLIRNTNAPVLVVRRTASYAEQGKTRPLRKILVPLDGSKLAEEIIQPVIELAKKNDSSVVLLNVLIPTTYSQKQIEDARLPWWECDVEVAQTYLAEQAEWIRRAGVPASIDMTIGDDVADAINRSAARHRADVIAIATRGRGGLARMVRGSVADKVVRTARTSLLVVHPKAPAKVMTPREQEQLATAGFIPAA